MAKTVITLSKEKVEHSRAVYNFLDLLGDLGGLTEVFMLIVGFFVAPISEHNFIMKAARRLFIAKTKRDDLFLKLDPVVEGNYIDNIPEDVTPEEKIKFLLAGALMNLKNKAEAKLAQNKHKAIRISMYDNFMLFFANLLEYYGIPCCCYK